LPEAQTVEAAALGYLRRGWSIVPVMARGKQPLVPWRDFQQERVTPDEARAWFRHWPEANVGLVTGQISNLVVIDIDSAHGGERSLADLTARFGALPPTLTVRTGGGGRHLYFSSPADPVAVRSRVGVAPGIDVRAEGGMIVAPPSIHPSGVRYEWITPDDAGPTPVPLPRWLIALVRGMRPDGRGHGMRYWRNLAAEGVSEGTRNSMIASFAGHLMWCGVDLDVIKELLLCWNRVRARPPLSDDEVIRTVESIHRTHIGHRSSG
jgi:hypothetical protein